MSISNHIETQKYFVRAQTVSVYNPFCDSPRRSVLEEEFAMRLLKTRKYLMLQAAGLLLLTGAVVSAQKPKDNVSAAKHPNIAAAQRFSQQAWEKIVAAQQANEFDMQGHAQKAKDLLDQVNKELKLAAEAANKK
jgi:hypothetical protein